MKITLKLLFSVIPSIFMTWLTFFYLLLFLAFLKHLSTHTVVACDTVLHIIRIRTVIALHIALSFDCWISHRPYNVFVIVAGIVAAYQRRWLRWLPLTTISSALSGLRRIASTTNINTLVMLQFLVVTYRTATIAVIAILVAALVMLGLAFYALWYGYFSAQIFLGL